MSNEIFLHLGGAITLIWGIAHLFPTKSVVKNFGEISPDNKHIITMEWIVEGIALIHIGILIIGVTIIDKSSTISMYVYFCSVALLIILSLVSLFTGFRVNFLPFKLCPILFSLSATLILIGNLT